MGRLRKKKRGRRGEELPRGEEGGDMGGWTKDDWGVEREWGGRQESEVDALEAVLHPVAWVKLQYLAHRADTEVCGFGLRPDPERPLYVRDLVVPTQECSYAFCDPDMDDLAARSEPFYKTLPDGRIYNPVGTAFWVHTHPKGLDAAPSGHDERTFKDRGGDWAVMFILSQSGDVTCRIKVRTPLGWLVREIPAEVDWALLPDAWRNGGGVVDLWNEELGRVTKRIPAPPPAKLSGGTLLQGEYDDLYRLPEKYGGRTATGQREADWSDHLFPGFTKSNGVETPSGKEVPDEYKEAWAEYLDELEWEAMDAATEPEPDTADVELQVVEKDEGGQAVVEDMLGKEVD